MGACCSSPAVADPLGAVDIRAASAESPRHHEESLSDMVLAAVHAANHQSSGHHHHHHHRHHQHHSVHVSTAAHSHTRAPKQQQHLLQVVSPRQQPLQQQHAVSPRSYHQLHQLLPAAPLQHLEHGHNQTSSLQTQHNKHSHIVRSSGSGSGSGFRSMLSGFHADAADSTAAGSADQARSMATPAQQRMHSASSGSSIAPADALSPAQLLAVCEAVLQEEPAFQAAGISPLLLASLCLIESGGCPHAKQHREHLGDTAHGLCQVLLSTAQWLAGSQGFDRHGTHPTVKDLEHPKTCAYFAAAYLTLLSRYGGSARSEGFVARAYHAGPKGVDTAAAHSYLQKYLKAKHCLTQVAKAMSVTAAAAALAVQVQLPADAAGAAWQCPATAAGMSAQQDAKLAPPAAAAAAHPKDQSMQDQDSTCLRDTAAIAAAAPAGSSQCSHNSSGAGTCAGRQVLVRRATADLVLALCSDWEDVDQATGKAQPATAGAGLGAGSILAHMLPSRWGLAGSKQHGQQAVSRGGEGALALVAVTAADLRTAWQKLLYISPGVAYTALAHATAAAALAPMPDPDWRIGTADAGAVTGTAAAAPAGSSRRDSSDGSSAAGGRVPGAASRQGSVGTQAAPLSGQAVDLMPCVMHVVGHGESLQRIASVCSLGVSDLLAANPDVKDADTVHHNDCIAVPLPAVFPRLYVVQPGDTLHSIARAHEVSVGRVLAKNPELTDPGRLQPGWVVALPGLKGDSQVALPSDWLSEASLTADLPQQQAAWQLQSAPGADGDAELTVTLAVQQQQHQGVGSRRQRTLAGTVSEPGQWDGPYQHGGLPATVSDPGPGGMARDGQQQEPELLPAVGSGAFLFTVGSFSNVSDGRSSTPAVHGTCSGRPSLHKQRQEGQRPQQRQPTVGQRSGAKKTRTRMAQQQ